LLVERPQRWLGAKAETSAFEGGFSFNTAFQNDRYLRSTLRLIARRQREGLPPRKSSADSGWLPAVFQVRHP